MAHFLRDQQITNVTISEEMIKQISALFVSRTTSFNMAIPVANDESKKALLSYTIRFDEKGYRVYSIDELLQYFQQAKEVERILFTLETGESLRSSRNIGAVMELKFDQKNPNNCSLMATSDDKDWVDASFSAVQDILIKCKNKNGWIRTAWMELVVQIAGVALGFFISLWAAVKISPKLTVENSFVICFLFVLLIFSNTWSYLNRQIFYWLNSYFPNVKFYRPDKDRVNWIIQTIIAAILGALVLGLLGLMYSYFVSIVGSFIAKSK
ncbi:TPA: hypothetical protein ACT9LC_001693 [Legionella pneumophila]